MAKISLTKVSSEKLDRLLSVSKDTALERSDTTHFHVLYKSFVRKFPPPISLTKKED